MEEQTVKLIGTNSVAIGSWRTVEHNGNRISHVVTIVRGSYMGHGGFFSPADISIIDADNIRALRDLCNEVLAENKNATSAAN